MPFGVDLKEPHKKPVSPFVEPLRTEAPADMVEMPKRPFLYGEKRVREVFDHDYWIDKYAVTNEKYRAFHLGRWLRESDVLVTGRMGVEGRK
jgi:formylglycine-generating enzyme required for sulfatase activity